MAGSRDIAHYGRPLRELHRGGESRGAVLMNEGPTGNGRVTDCQVLMLIAGPDVYELSAAEALQLSRLTIPLTICKPFDTLHFRRKCLSIQEIVWICAFKGRNRIN